MCSCFMNNELIKNYFIYRLYSMAKINPVNQEYLNSFQKNLKARENMLAYQTQKYKEYLQTLYPNNTPIETILNKDYENYRKLEEETKNVIMSSGTENYKQQAKLNLETLLSVSNAQTVLETLTDAELKHLNTLFPLMKTNLKSVKFYSTDEFVKYINTFIKQQINDNTDTSTLAISQSTLDALTENETLRENLEEAQRQIQQNILNQIYKGVKEITNDDKANYDGTKRLIANISRYLTEQSILTEEQFENDKYKEECANQNGYSVIRLLQEDVFYDTYDWVKELCEAIEQIKSSEGITNIYLSKNGEYDNY